jgi:hypothetical protein
LPKDLVDELGGIRGFGENYVGRTDDGSSAYIDLRELFPLGLNFYGRSFDGLYLNNNGSVTFGTAFSAFTPTAISGGSPIIAPYLADADTRGTVGDITPGGTSKGTNLAWYDLDASTRSFTATWDDVGYFNRRTDKLNAVQLRLIGVQDAQGEYSGDFNIELRYEAVNWTTGDFSGGSGGLGGTISRAGFGGGDGLGFYELPQSGNQAGMLDLESASNIGDSGRFLFAFRDGTLAPTVAIDDVSVNEGSGSPNAHATVRLRLSAPSAVPITVDYATADGTGLAGQTYVAQRGTVTFAPGATEQTVQVEIIGDTKAGTDQTFTLRLTGATPASITDNEGIVTIRNDDGIVIGDDTEVEGTSGTPTVFSFPVRLLTAATVPVTVDYAVDSGTATAAVDFITSTGQLAFAAGETEKFITVQVGADAIFEPDEHFVVTLSNPTGAALVDAVGKGTIRNDDGFAIDDLRRAEGSTPGATNATLTIRLLSPLSKAASVDWATVSDSAIAGQDFTSSSGTASFAPGATTTTIAIPLTSDFTTETDETFFVALSNPTEVDIADGAAVVTIADDDGFSITDVFITEGDSGIRNATFTVSLLTTLNTSVTVDYATADGTATAGADYTATSGTLSFAATQSTRTFTVPITTDTTQEGNETFTVVLSNPSGGSSIARATATATILNEDGLSAGDATVTEGDSGTTQVTVPVILNAPASGEVEVAWTTANGTATAGTDYVGASGTLVFAAGETSQNITVDVIGETVFEGNETFRIELSDAKGASIVDHSATITINSNDTQPAPTVSVYDTSLTEGGGTDTTAMVFTVALSRTDAAPISVTYAVSDGTATAGADYVASSGTLTIPAGEQFATIAVPLIGNATIAGDRSFTVALDAPTGGATLGVAKATGTILEDDTRISIAPLAADKPEGNAGTTGFTFTLSRSGDTSGSTDVTWSAIGIGGNPALASDFAGNTLPAGTESFAPGQTSRTITLLAATDAISEADEDFVVLLSAPTGGAQLGTSAALGTIGNDDTSYAIAATSAAKPEGTGGSGATTAFTFSVTRTGNTDSGGSIDWSVLGLAGPGIVPITGADFAGAVLPSGTLAFDAGETSKLITLALNADLVVESDEGFMVRLANPSDGDTLGTAAAIGLVGNDDVDMPAELAFSTTRSTKFEGNSGTTPITFTVTRTDGLAGNHSARWSVVGTKGTGTMPADAKDFPGAVLPSGTVTFLAGETSRTITVDVAADATPELNERFTITLSDPLGGATIASGAASSDGVILNDDSPLRIASGPGMRNEGSGGGTTSFSFTVARGGNNGQGVSAKWAVAGVDGTGTLQAAASDFAGGVFPAGTVTFAPAETTKTITFDVNADAVPEFNERFRITLSNPTGGATISPSASGIDGVIFNDDVVLRLSAGPGLQPEGSGGGTTPFIFTVTRSGNNGQAVEAAWSVAGLVGAGTLPALASDFAGGVFPSGTVSFAAGERTRTITVDVNADTTNELNERFALTLADPTGGAILDIATLGAVIMNDDTPPPGPAPAPATWSAFSTFAIDPDDLIPMAAPLGAPSPSVAMPGTVFDTAAVTRWHDPQAWRHHGAECGAPDY